MGVVLLVGVASVGGARELLLLLLLRGRGLGYDGRGHPFGMTHAAAALTQTAHREFPHRAIGRQAARAQLGHSNATAIRIFDFWRRLVGPKQVAAAAAAVAASVNSNTFDAFSASSSASPQPAQQQLQQQQQLSPSPAMSVAMESVVALYNYTAMNDDELTFSKGQIITNVQKDEADWWKGDLLQGALGTAVVASGLFPSNYVQAMAPEGSSTASSEGRHHGTDRH